MYPDVLQHAEYRDDIRNARRDLPGWGDRRGKRGITHDDVYSKSYGSACCGAACTAERDSCSSISTCDDALAGGNPDSHADVAISGGFVFNSHRGSHRLLEL